MAWSNTLSGTVSRTHHRRDLRDDVIQAFKVLNIESGVDVDAHREQIFDILVTLDVPRTGCVGVRQFVHQRQRGRLRQNRVHIQFGEDHAAVFDLVPRDDFQPFQQGVGFGAAVGFHVGCNHIHALSLPLLRCQKHCIGLANAGSVAQKYQQLAACCLLLLILDSS